MDIAAIFTTNIKTHNETHCSCIQSLILGSLAIFLHSCGLVDIHGSFHGLYSYEKKVSKEMAGLIRQPALPLCALQPADAPMVYAINGKQLSQCLSGINEALVYVWSPNCHSTLCASPQLLQKACDLRGADLFVVAEYYDVPAIALKRSLKRPIFGIDGDYYRSHLTRKYLRLFMTDLLGEDVEFQCRYYLFRHGQLADTSSSLAGIQF